MLETGSGMTGREHLPCVIVAVRLRLVPSLDKACSNYRPRTVPLPAKAERGTSTLLGGLVPLVEAVLELLAGSLGRQLAVDHLRGHVPELVFEIRRTAR